MELQAHLDTCEACLRHLAAYRRGVMVFRALETDVPTPGALFESVEHRLQSEGDSASSPEPGRRRGAPARSLDLSWRRIGTGLAAVLAFLLVRADAPMPDPAAALTSTISTIVSDTPRRSVAAVRVPSEPIEIDPVPVTRLAGGEGSVRSGPERRRMVDPFELVIERRLAEMEGRMRRISWQTPGSVTEGWNRPRIGGAPVATASPTVYTVASADVSPPWSIEAAIVVP